MTDETKQAATEAGARAAYAEWLNLNPRLKILPWDEMTADARRGWLRDAEVHFDAMAPFIERAGDKVRMTEEEYSSMRQAVVAVARLRLMHRPYRGVADVDTCQSCSGLAGDPVLYPCPTVSVLAVRSGIV